MSTDFPAELRRHRVAPEILDRARAMRREAAPAERILWHCLRDRRLNGFKFRRQVGMGRYVADFYCAECRFIVESDGDSHALRKDYDERRTRWLRENGYDVVRYLNSDVFENVDGVLNAILNECEARSKRAPEVDRGPQR